MKLFTQEQERQLRRTAGRNAECIGDDGNTIDFKPVVKFFVRGEPLPGF